MISTEVVILCGGLGTRLRSVVKDVPKPMALVAGRPFLEIVLAQFRKLGFMRAVFSSGYMASVITDHFGERFEGMDLRYSIDPVPLGTGGAARAGAQLCEGETILVCNGDTYVEFDCNAAISLSERTRSPVIVTNKVTDTERYGRIEVAPNLEARFSGTGVTGEGFICGGVYLLPRAALLESPLPAPFSLERLVFDPARNGPVYALEARGRFIDIGIPRDYELAQAMFLKE